jgi:nucleoside-diphosphate-sugar epimerase
MRIFLAGATGVIGRRVVARLLREGHQVTGSTRRPSDATALRARGADAVVVDVYDADALAEAVRSAAPDVVMHQLTDLGGGDRAANSAIRITGTRNLTDAALAAGVGRIVAQSICWAYEGGDEPATETTPLDLHGDPSRLSTVRGVAALERTVREVPEWVVLRYGLLYGPDTWYTDGGLLADTARAGRLPADADVNSFVHVDDAAAAAVAALSWPSGAVNVCDDEPAAGRDWVPAFCRSVGAPAPRPVPDAPRHDWARGADNHLARKELGWTPRCLSWRDGFASSWPAARRSGR